MSDIQYTTEDYVQLSGGDLGVYQGDFATPGTIGAAGTSIGWSAKSRTLGAGGSITDRNGDGLEAGEDFWISSGFKFLGYTVTVNGVDLPIFGRDFGTSFLPTAYVVGPTALLEQLPSSGLSNVFSAEAPDAYLCFAEGTAIATAGGGVPVEALRRGDHVLTADGATTEVLWIGRQSVSRRFADPSRQILVEIPAGALGEGLPHRDLRVTADHALMLDGLLVNAGALVGANGVAYVHQSDLPDTYTIYHVETEAHDIILAEGMPTETFIDYTGRQRFDNYEDYVALYGAERVISEHPAPRISSARLLPPHLRQRLRVQSAA